MAEILSIDPGLIEISRLNNQSFQFFFLFCVPSHFVECAAQRCASTSQIIFQVRSLGVSSSPQCAIDPNGLPSQKLISLTR
jgi:hypothetical protein